MMIQLVMVRGRKWCGRGRGGGGRKERNHQTQWASHSRVALRVAWVTWRWVFACRRRRRRRRRRSTTFYKSMRTSILLFFFPEIFSLGAWKWCSTGVGFVWQQQQGVAVTSRKKKGARIEEEGRIFKKGINTRNVPLSSLYRQQRELATRRASMLRYFNRKNVDHHHHHHHRVSPGSNLPIWSVCWGVAFHFASRKSIHTQHTPDVDIIRSTGLKKASSALYVESLFLSTRGALVSPTAERRQVSITHMRLGSLCLAIEAPVC